MLSAQGALTRDTVYLVNGAQVGDRDIFTVGTCSTQIHQSTDLLVLLLLRWLIPVETMHSRQTA